MIVEERRRRIIEYFLTSETDRPAVPWCKIFINIMLCNIKKFLCPNQTTVGCYRHKVPANGN